MKSSSKPKKRVRKAPASLLDALQSETDAELLLLLEKSDAEMQARVCFEFGRRQSKGAVEPLRKRLKSEDTLLREAAAEALGRIGDPSAGEDLLRLFSDRSQPVPVRDTCAYALGRLAYKPAFQKLLTALADPSSTVRSCAVAALSTIGDAETRGPVEIALQTEGEPTVRRAMRELLKLLPQDKRKESIYKISVSAPATDTPIIEAPLVSGGVSFFRSTQKRPKKNLGVIRWFGQSPAILKDVNFHAPSKQPDSQEASEIVKSENLLRLPNVQMPPWMTPEDEQKVSV